jgi:hypothetical protein
MGRFQWVKSALLLMLKLRIGCWGSHHALLGKAW